MQKNTNVDKKIPVTTRVAGYILNVKVSNSGDEVLIALSASAARNETAALALRQLPKLRGCQAHTSVMLSDVDIKIFKKLGVQLTCESDYENGHVYH